jgi:hypothetical protein
MSVLNQMDPSNIFHPISVILSSVYSKIYQILWPDFNAIIMKVPNKGVLVTPTVYILWHWEFWDWSCVDCDLRNIPEITGDLSGDFGRTDVCRRVSYKMFMAYNFLITEPEVVLWKRWQVGYSCAVMDDNTANGHLSTRNKNKFVPQYDRCTSPAGHYAEKWQNCSKMQSVQFILEFEIKNTKCMRCNLIRIVTYWCVQLLLFCWLSLMKVVIY